MARRRAERVPGRGWPASNRGLTKRIIIDKRAKGTRRSRSAKDIRGRSGWRAECILRWRPKRIGEGSLLRGRPEGVVSWRRHGDGTKALAEEVRVKMIGEKEVEKQEEEEEEDRASSRVRRC